MKFLPILFMIISHASNADTCREYAHKTVKCYEIGFLDEYYDETGTNCGDNELSIWNLNESTNKTIESNQLDYQELSYSGGKGWEYKCDVNFQNVRDQFCSYELTISIGTEDSDLRIKDFNCK